MKLLGETGKLVAGVPIVARQLKLALACGFAAGISNVAWIAFIVWAIIPMLNNDVHPQQTLLGLGLSTLCLLISFVLRHQAEMRAHEGSFMLEETLRNQLVDHLSKLPLGAVQNLGSGRIRKIVQDDVKGLHIAVADAVPFIGISLSQPLAAILLLMTVQWRLACFALLLLPVSLICMGLMNREHQLQRNNYNQASEEINAGVIELVQGMAVMRTFDNGQAGWRRFTSTLHEFTVAVASWMAMSKMPWKINRIVGGSLPTAVIIILSGTGLIIMGQVSWAEWLLAMMVGTQAVKAIEPLMHLANYLNDASAAARRISDVLKQPVLIEPAISSFPDGYRLELKNVSFRYPGKSQWALKDVTLKLPQGTRCAIVGASGSGKSTLARLIPRFYDVSEGAIELGGEDIRGMQSFVLLQQMALVLQEPYLISGTLEDNLRMGKLNASSEEINNVIKAAGLDELINQLPEGLQTKVSEKGSSLSGGQRQRITFARALLSKAPLLILDEATSYLDAHNDNLIQETLSRLPLDCTVITIAHRLQTIINADIIVVMHQGQIVERGNHDRLLALNGHYTRLWQHAQQASNWTLNREETV